MSELSSDGKTMFVDRSLPRKIILKGKSLDPAEPLLHHEMAEYAEMRRVVEAFEKQNGHKPNDAQRKRIYTGAHRGFGTPAERQWMRSNGYDWAAWEAWCRGELSRLEKEKAPNPPPRPDVKVFPHGHGDLEYAGKS